MKHRVVDRNVRFRFVEDDLLFVGRAFATGLDRERQKNAVDFLVIAQIGFDFDLCAVFHSLRQNPDLEEMIRIEINKTHVAVLAHDLQLVRERAVHIFGAEIFDRAAFVFPINQRPIDLRILDQRFESSADNFSGSLRP